MEALEAPVPTILAIKRLSRYLAHIRHLRKTGVSDGFSASQLGRELGVHETQVRKDLALTGLEGRPKTGHSIDEAISAIESYFNIGNTTEAFLIGVGHLGTAILGHHTRKSGALSGIRIIAAFDAARDKIGTTVHGIRILAVDKVPDLARRMNIAIGIICTPPEAAQGAVDLLVAGGVRAIWNFAPIGLAVPQTVILENSDLESGLAYLKRRLSEQKS